MINDTPLHEIQATKDVLMYDDIELKCPYKNYDKLSWLKVLRFPCEMKIINQFEKNEMILVS